MTTHYQVHCPSTKIEKIRNASIIYATGTLPDALKSYDDALNPDIWSQHFCPFSAVIMHDSQQELIIIRDHLGLEPIYFTTQGTFNIYVAGNLPKLFSLLPKTPAFDDTELSLLFSTQHLYSDHTLYKNVFRIEPGYLLHFHQNGKAIKKAFWTLSPHGESIFYQDSHEYVEHFSMLLRESISQSIPPNTAVAAEFSAGLDSTAVYCAAHASGLQPKLFMHGAPQNSDSEKRYQTRYEKAFLDAYPNVEIERINRIEFDLLNIFDQYAEWFKGPAPYLFFMFAHPLHHAVSSQKYSILLSGFGGDQGVSSHVPYHFFIPELISQKNYKEAWGEMLGAQPKNALQKLRLLLAYTTYLHPKIKQTASSIRKVRTELYNLFHRGAAQKITLTHPYDQFSYRSMREAEHAILQGQHSHEIRMRIEYSSLVSKNMGFEYRYPLLYPKLLEFFLSIPRSEKRHHGQGRYLIRRYLKQFISNDIFSSYLKKEGLDIVPATMTHYQEQFARGYYAQAFQNLPYNHIIQSSSYPLRLRHSIKGYMLKPFLS